MLAHLLLQFTTACKCRAQELVPSRASHPERPACSKCVMRQILIRSNGTSISKPCFPLFHISWIGQVTWALRACARRSETPSHKGLSTVPSLSDRRPRCSWSGLSEPAGLLFRWAHSVQRMGLGLKRKSVQACSGFPSLSQSV